MKTMNQKLKALSTTFTFSALLLLQNSPTSFCEDGTQSSGGAHKVQYELLDNYLARNILDQNGENKAAFDAIKKEVKQIKAMIPDLGDEMQKTLDEKTWYLVDRKLPKLPKNEQITMLDAEEAANQNDFEVFVDKNYFQNSSLKQKIDTIRHELIQGVRLKSNKLMNPDYIASDEEKAPIDKRAVDRINQQFILGKVKSADDLQQILYKYNFAKYFVFATAKEKTEITNLMKNFITDFKDTCKSYSNFWHGSPGNLVLHNITDHYEQLLGYPAFYDYRRNPEKSLSFRRESQYQYSEQFLSAAGFPLSKMLDLEADSYCKRLGVIPPSDTALSQESTSKATSNTNANNNGNNNSAQDTK